MKVSNPSIIPKESVMFYTCLPEPLGQFVVVTLEPYSPLMGLKL